MTDQPSQRAMKAAESFCREDATDQTAIAAQIDAEFPAYLEIREALELGHRILIQRNLTDDEREIADLMWAALAKARKEI